MFAIPRSVPRGLGLALVLIVVAGLMTASARPRRDEWNLSRYQDPAFQDSLMTSYPGAGVVLLNRDFVEFGQKGERVWGDVEHEWLLLVRDVDAMASYRTLVYPEYPGREIKEIEAVRISGSKRDGVNVKKEKRYDCGAYSDHRNWIVDFEQLQPGDILAVHMKYRIDGANPFFSHEFDGQLYVLQSDVTMEVPRGLMEDHASQGWDWWASAYPRYVAEKHWEKPTSWRFRWGERDIPPLEPGVEPRVVATTWIFDPLYGTKVSAITRDAQAAGGGNLAYHGPTISAMELSGRSALDRSQGRQVNEQARPEQATFGEITWSKVGERVIQSCLVRRLDSDGRAVDQIAAGLVDGVAQPSEIVSRLARHVAREIETVDASVAESLCDLHNPTESYREGCATLLDKAVLLTALLRSQGLTACPLLLKSGSLDLALKSVKLFDGISVMVEGRDGTQFVDLTTGQISSKLPPGRWGGMLTLPIDGETGPEIIIGDQLASLIG